MLEGDLRRRQQQPERLERLAQQLAARQTRRGGCAAALGPAGTTPSSDSTLASTAVSSCRRSERVK